ncbi:MAG: TatD family hydrolase [Synergistetes bacterium]|nr:TatD family hydrolase [Synergistota bacterium]
MKLIDSHCHLNDPAFDKDIEEVIKRSRDNGVEYCVVIGYDVKSSKKAIEMAEKYNCVYATVGIHPEESKNAGDRELAEIEKLTEHPKVVGIGETGLDYYHIFSPIEKQKEIFIKQLKLARKLNLPVVIHSREAEPDTFDIVKEYAKDIKGVMHCFSGTLKMAKLYTELKFYISISGAVTFRKAKTLKEVVKGIKIKDILIETDAPYLTPHPYRGKRNEPSYLPYIADAVAKIKELPLEEVALHTSHNTRNLFNFP